MGVVGQRLGWLGAHILLRKCWERNACAFSSALPPCRRLSFPPHAPSLPHMQRLALGCGPPILLLGAQACVGWAGGAARPSRITPTPRWCPPVRLRMNRRLPDKCPGAGRGLVRSPSRAAAYRPASSCATRTRLHRSDRSNVHRAAALRQRGWPGSLLWPAPGPLCSARPLRLTSPTNAAASVTRTRLHRSDRANVHRAAVPIGGAGRSRPTLERLWPPHPPYTQPGLCASRVRPMHPRRWSACACAPGRAPIRRRCLVPLRRPDRSRTAIFCPHIAAPKAAAAERASPSPWRLARSCTASGHAPAAQNCPRLRTTLAPCIRRLSGGRQRPCSVDLTLLRPRYARSLHV